ncbi:MAG: hypothetical protein IJA97_00845 [Clostridia bacterium]|nr:hypothetical protein [Clostridia bacterium]
MAEIYSVPDRFSALSSRFDEKFLKKDYLSALLTIDSLESSGADKLDISYKRARVYFEMGRYLQSAQEWLNYLSLSKNEKSYGRAYNGLGACFFKINDDKLAGYYFNRQILSDKKAVYDYSYVTAEFFEEMLSAEKNYYLAYPYEKADFTKTLERSEELLKTADYDGVINELSVIPKSSKDYHSALITTAIARYFKGDVIPALKDIEEAVEINPNAVALCNAISMFNAEKNEEKSNYYFDLLKSINVESDEDAYKVAMIYCERGDDEKVSIYAEKYLKANPYDASMLQIYGIALYNLNEMDKAEDCFRRAYQISRSYVSKRYLKRLLEEIDVFRLDYTFDLQHKDKAKAYKDMADLMNASADERFVRQKEIYELSEYAFSSGSYQLQSSAITLLGDLSTEVSVELMKNVLLQVNVYDRIKAGVLGFLTADGFDGELPCCFGNVFSKIKFYKAVFIEDNAVFTEAYAYVFAKLAPIEKDMKPIHISAELIYHILKDKGLLDEVTDVRSLGAVIYELSLIGNIKSRREFAKFFEANLKEIKRLKSLIQDD